MSRGPYVAIRRPWLVGLQLVVAMGLAALLSGSSLNVARAPFAGLYRIWQLEPAAAGRLVVAIPALVAAATWREPTGDTAVSAARRLTPIRLAHFAILAIYVAVASQVVGFVDHANRAQLLANALIFLAAALISVALWGLAGIWAIPIVLVLLPIIPVSMPFWLGSWAYDGSSGAHRLVGAVLVLVAAGALALWSAPHPLLRARSSAERNAEAAG